MKRTELIMGMPIAVEVVGGNESDLRAVFDWFRAVDDKYSPFKPGSEVSQINAGLPEGEWSEEMREVLALCEQTKEQTGGYFEVMRDGRLDPSGLVKGWAIAGAAKLLKARGREDFCVSAGGDIQTCGRNEARRTWKIGIRNPFAREEIIKVIEGEELGVATSGLYERGEHIYDPHSGQLDPGVKSLTVVAKSIFDADRLATAAFAMGRAGIGFIEGQPEVEGYLIDADQTATFTSGFEAYSC